MPDDLDVLIELKNWLFALEGAEEAVEIWSTCNGEVFCREDRCWHTTFRNLRITGKSSDKPNLSNSGKVCRKLAFPVESITVSFLTYS